MVTARTLRTQARILETALDLFERQGYNATTTAQIADGAGVTQMTFFRHFPTKAALLEAVFVGRLRGLAEQAESLSESDDPGGALFDFMTGVVERSVGKNAYIDALIEAGDSPGG